MTSRPKSGAVTDFARVGATAVLLLVLIPNLSDTLEVVSSGSPLMMDNRENSAYLTGVVCDCGSRPTVVLFVTISRSKGWMFKFPSMP